MKASPEDNPLTLFDPPRVRFVAATRVHPAFVLRSYEPGDGALKTQACASFEHLRPWMPWAAPFETVEEAEAIVRRFSEQYAQKEDFVLAIVSEDGGTLLGGTGFHLREGPLDTRCAEIGLWIAAQHAGRGFGTHVLCEMITWGFSDWPFLRLSWRCDSRNVASRRVAEKAGMQHEGTLRCQRAEVGPGRRDTLCYASLRSEWARDCVV